MTTYPIIVGYDGSAGAHAALRWALDEGSRTGAPVTVMFVFEWLAVAGPIAPGPRNWPDHGARDDAQKMVDAAVTQAFQTHPRVAVTGEVVGGSAAIILQERSREARLMVLGSRGHDGFAELLLGSTTVAVSAHAHCPVVVVRGEEPGGGPVIAAVDGSDCALLALEYAFEQAAARDTGLRVLRAWQPPAPRWRPPEYDLEEQATAERVELDELLASWRVKYPAVDVAVDVLAGPTGRVLVDATRGAQLVVVGSRGRGGFRGLLLGSVSQQLLHHAHCPVAVVRELPALAG
ncbi:universal stress protein [Phytohabitans sp. ZYX-F-186]|uniref:Universal stress protein n=1 Tax=Phytohabitans maris TaxID=3071409 RepID=A0ABU0ZUD5_9ACTN|nr:universal stress protein [Phytohabitans sp. ZYX-F-186]MDQ7910401.1 universal stress protein [Phytohabitans sp. ZYX-F-186]